MKRWFLVLFLILISFGVTQAAAVKLTATALVPGNNFKATLIVEPKSVIADGQSQIAVLVLVNSTEGEPLANQTVVITTSRPDKDVIERTQPVTGTNGVAIFKIRSQFTGQSSLTASIGDNVIATGSASFFSRGRAFLLTSSPLIALAGLFVAFEFFRWFWLLLWRRRETELQQRQALN